MTSAILLQVPWAFDMLGGVDVVVDRLRVGLEKDGRFKPLIGVIDWECSDITPNQVDDRTFLPLALPSWPNAGSATARIRAYASITRRAVQVATALRRNNVAVFHAHYPALSLLSVAVARQMGLWRGQLVLSFHGSDVTQIDVKLAAWHLIASQTQAVTACSEALARDVRALGLFGPRWPLVIHNGIDLEAFRAEAKVPHWSTLAGATYLVSLGNFVPGKSHDLILRAFANIADDYPHLLLILAGGSENGAWLAHLQQLALTLRVSQRVRFLADVPHHKVASLLVSARALVHAAKSEAFGLVLIEAGALGVPIVAPLVGGIPEVVGDCAHTYRSQHVDDLVVAIRAVLHDPGSARQMAKQMEARVETRFSADTMTRRYLELYALGS